MKISIPWTWPSRGAGTGWDDFYRYPTQIGIMRRIPYRPGNSTSEILRRIDARDRDGPRG